MSMKEEVLEAIPEGSEVELDDVYAAMAERTTPSVRGTLNLMVKRGELTRVRQGVYARASRQVKVGPQEEGDADATGEDSSE